MTPTAFVAGVILAITLVGALLAWISDLIVKE
jgi:hypothetical protein